MNVQQLENQLWETANQLRANPKLTAVEYAMPVRGLICLRHTDNLLKAYLCEIQDGLAELNDKAVELAGRIAGNFEELSG
jgi:type I restriction enzyme M protein